MITMLLRQLEEVVQEVGVPVLVARGLQRFFIVQVIVSVFSLPRQLLPLLCYTCFFFGLIDDVSV